jgi:PAS domain S-box-containing protein
MRWGFISITNFYEIFKGTMNQTILTIDAYLALFVVLINLVFAILILVRTSRTTLYLVFFFACLSNMLWNFGDAVTYFSGNRFWFYLSLIGSGMLPALMFHFINSLVRPERKSNAWVIIAYIFSGFLAFSSPIALFHPGTKQFVDSIYWNILYLVLLGPFIFAGIIILITTFNRTKSEEEKSRLRYILVATIIAVITGLTDLVQLFKIPIPPLGHLGCFVYSSILAIGVFKHRKAYDIFVQMRMKLEALSVNAEKALRESEEKYRTILYSLEEGYFEVDLSGNLTFFNDAFVRWSGYSKEELMGMNNRQYMDEETAKKVYQVFNEVYRTGEPANPFDWEIILKDGTRRWIETSVSLIRDKNGQPIGFRGIARDVTERKQMEEEAKIHQQQLMQAGKMVALGTLVSSVAHEINNPNNFIMLNTPLLKEAWQHVLPILDEYYEKNKDFMIGGMGYPEMCERIPRLLSGITDGSKRIQQIVEDLRDFVRRDASDMNQSVDVNTVLRSAISLLSNMITKSTSHFSVQYAERLPTLKGNSHRLEQVMINLIQNACQALPDIRRGISLSTSFNEKTCSIVVKVQDEGIGIPPEVLLHITDSFFTTKSDSGGIGLGLSISSRIVKEHGGTLTFTSEPGKGTTAEIILPVLGANHNPKGATE